MNRPTQSRWKISCLLALALPVALAACGAQASDAAQTARLSFSKDRVAQEAPVEVRRMLSDTSRAWNFLMMSPSPDGRYLTNIAWWSGGGDVSFLDLSTGEETPIPNQVPNGFADVKGAFSPDGSRVAYPHWGETGWEVLSIGVNGSDPQVHLRYSPPPGEEPTHDRFPSVADWSPDGQYLLINGFAPENEDHLATIDVTTNEYRILREDLVGPWYSSFSPDGRFVAFQVDPGSQESGIFLVPSVGGQPTTLIQSPDYEALLGWLPDGSGILFQRNADDSQAIWKLPVRDGQPAGPPELVKDDVGDMRGLGFSDDAYFYGVAVSQPGVHTASFDLETGRVLEALEPVADVPGLGTTNGTWSPDGTRLAYISREPGRNDTFPSRLIVRALSGEILQDFRLPPLRILGGMGWTAHGLVVFGRLRDQDNSFGFYLVSLETGEATYLRPHTTRGGPFSVSEDGSSFFFVDPGGAIIEYDLSTGTERVLVERDGFASVGLPDAPDARIYKGIVSPDGDNILYRIFLGGPDGGWALEIFSRSSGESRVIGGLDRLSIPTWSPDGRYVVAGSSEDGTDALTGRRRQRNFRLLRISVEDGSVISLAEGREQFSGPKVSPDGRHILVRTGSLLREIWRMTFNSGR